MSEPSAEQPETTVVETATAAPAAETRTVVVAYVDAGFLHRHGLALLALLFAVAGCVLGGVALSRSGDHPRMCAEAGWSPAWHVQFLCGRAPRTAYPGGFAGPGRIRPIIVKPNLKPGVRPINPGGPMIPAPTMPAPSAAPGR